MLTILIRIHCIQKKKTKYSFPFHIIMHFISKHSMNIACNVNETSFASEKSPFQMEMGHHKQSEKLMDKFLKHRKFQNSHSKWTQSTDVIVISYYVRQIERMVNTLFHPKYKVILSGVVIGVLKTWAMSFHNAVIAWHYWPFNGRLNEIPFMGVEVMIKMRWESGQQNHGIYRKCL